MIITDIIKIGDPQILLFVPQDELQSKLRHVF